MHHSRYDRPLGFGRMSFAPLTHDEYVRNSGLKGGASFVSGLANAGRIIGGSWEQPPWEGWEPIIGAGDPIDAAEPQQYPNITAPRNQADYQPPLVLPKVRSGLERARLFQDRQ